jgi:hypothetical protein
LVITGQDLEGFARCDGMRQAVGPGCLVRILGREGCTPDAPPEVEHASERARQRVRRQTAGMSIGVHGQLLLRPKWLDRMCNSGREEAVGAVRQATVWGLSAEIPEAGCNPGHGLTLG